MLEKILQEIEQYEESYEGPGTLTLCPRWVKEIIRKNILENDGWIPVEDGMPEEDDFYIATLDGEIIGEKEPFSGLAEFENGKWVDDEKDYKCVIAWRPLSEPYIKDGE